MKNKSIKDVINRNVIIGYLVNLKFFLFVYKIYKVYGIKYGGLDTIVNIKEKNKIIKDLKQLFFNIDLAESYVVGDRWRDIDAGYNAGCKTILINRY